MPFAQVSLDDSAFQASFKAAMERDRLIGEAYAVTTADAIVVMAKALVAKETERLERSIHHDPPERTALGVSVKVIAGGPGIRETLPQEFGTYKMRAQPYMRPAFAAAARGLRSVGVATQRNVGRASRAVASRSRNRG